MLRLENWNTKCKQKPQLKKLLVQSTTAAGGRGVDVIGSHRVVVHDLQKKIGELREERRQFQEEFNKIVKSRQAAMSGMSEVFDERASIQRDIEGIRENIRNLRNEKQEKLQAVREAKAKQRQVREEERERHQKMRNEEIAKKKLLEELEIEAKVPFFQEVEQIDFVEKYLKQLQNKSDDQKSTTTAVAGQEAAASVTGTTTVLNKSERNVEYFLAPTKGSKRGKSHQKKHQKESTAFTHSIDTMQIFSRLKIDTPIKVEDIQKCLEQLEVAKKDLTDRQAVEYVKREERRKERELKVNSTTVEDTQPSTALEVN